MTSYRIAAPRLCGIVTALPETVSENADLAGRFGEEVIRNIIKATGIERRPVSRQHTVSALGAVAAEQLVGRLGWDKASIGLLIVVTQTPDYPLPSTACVLQRKLGLGDQLAAFDLALGCSGYVYGLSVAASMMQAAGISRALLVAGDMTSRMIGEADRALAPLFGDAVSVTALELGGEGEIGFDLGSDGSGAPYLISRTGGLAEPGPPELFMDGTQVMAFSLKRVAPTIGRALDAAAMAIGAVTLIVLHQANAMMIRTLGQKIGARPDQLVYAVKDFGNTSSASIPLALCHRLSTAPSPPRLSLLLCGFGVGWSWATAAWPTAAPEVHDIIRVA